MSSRLLLLLIISVLWAAPALGQDTTEDEEPSQPTLPEITPREIQIRGKLDVSLPSLERPALTGLLRETRLEPLPPLAPPAAEAPDAPQGAPQALTDDNDPGAPSFTALPPPTRSLLEAGGGRYFSRFARGHLNLPFAEKWMLRTRLDYAGTDGFEPFEDENVKTPADRFDGALTLRTERNHLSAALTLDGFFEQRILYGADLTDPPTPSANDHPNRDLYGGSAALEIETGGRFPISGSINYDAAQIETAVVEGQDPLERSEQRLRASLRAEAPLGPLRAEASVRFSTADSSLSGSFPGEASFLDAGGGLWLLDETNYRFFAGARVLTFDAGEAEGTYVAPDVRLEWSADPHLTLYARTRPAAEANPLAALYRENPSLLAEASSRPTLRTVDAEGGLRVFAGLVELNAFGGYKYAPHLLFFEEPRGNGPLNLYTRGITTARYAEARILRFGGSVSMRYTDRLHTSLSATFRDGTLTDEDTAIPYFSPLTAQALLSYDFGRGHVQLTGTFESPRYLDRSETEEVGVFADLDVKGSYALTPSLGLVVRLENLPAGALERYDRYPRPPIVVGSGLRVRF